MAGQAQLLQLSSSSEQLFAQNSGHNVEFDEPEAAVDAIVRTVKKIRQTTQ